VSETLSVAVVYGSVRSGRQGIRAARFVCQELESRGIEPVMVDPAEKRLPLLDLMYKEYAPGHAPDVLEELATLFRRVDGFAIVSGEYNHGIPPALSNLLDHFLEEYFWRPAGIITYSAGRWGGVRAAMQLRMTLAELGMVTIPSTLPIANVEAAFDLTGAPSDPHTTHLAERFFSEFSWYMQTLRAGRLTMAASI
jgi:NAD(P)H-dependent FMN reductase